MVQVAWLMPVLPLCQMVFTPAQLSVSTNQPGAAWSPGGLVNTEPQLQSRFGVVGDLVFSGEIDKLSARYTVGVYNVADSRFEAAPSREYRQRFFLMNGRTFLANVAVSF